MGFDTIEINLVYEWLGQNLFIVNKVVEILSGHVLLIFVHII